MNCEATRPKGTASESDCLTGKRTPNSQMDLDTDNTWEQCSACTGMFKGKRGLKIHHAKTGCGKQLSKSQRKTPRGDKSEATSTQDTDHSDASGRVSLKTTRRGNGAQFTGAIENLYKVTKEIRIKKMASETCNEEGMVAKEEATGWKNTKVRGEKQILGIGSRKKNK